MRVSVAIATYNGARFVGQQLESILAGTVVPDEVVISDDASSDDTLEIAERVFTREDAPTLVVVRGTATVGVTANFARALAACSGDLVVLADQDDVWHPDRLAAALPGFDDPAVLLQHADARLVDAEGAPLGSTLFATLGVRTDELAAIADGRPFEAFVRRNLATGATVVVRRQLIDTASPFPPEWVHDEWLAAIAAATGAVRVIERPLIDYRQHGGNQIGAAARTVAYLVSRFFESRGDRFAVLAMRSRLLVEKLEGLDAPAPALDLARSKARFEEVRSTYPRVRVLRLRPVLREALRGSYGALSSQRWIDVVRDLLQPA